MVERVRILILIQCMADKHNRRVFPEAAVDVMTKRKDGSLSIAQRMLVQAQVARDEAEKLAEARVQDMQSVARALAAERRLQGASTS